MTARQALQDDQRIEIALRIAAMDLGTLSARRALDATWRDLGAFLGHSSAQKSLGIGFVGEAVAVERMRDHVDDHRRRVIAECQSVARAVLKLLDGVADGDEVFCTVTGEVTVAGRLGTGQGLSFRAEGRPEAFRLTLLYLLCGPAGSRLRQCPQCGARFMRIRRQIYCTDTCTNKATWQNYPAADKRRAREKYYEKNGWSIGARAALQPLATEVGTGRKKAPQLKRDRMKKARHSTSGNSGR